MGGVFGYSMYQAGKVNQPQASATTKTEVKKTATPTPKKAAGVGTSSYESFNPASCTGVSL